MLDTSSVLSMLFIAVMGFIGGFLGAQGGSGGIITLPSLLLLGIPAPVALATNRVSAIFLNLSASIPYIKKHKIHLPLFIPLFLISGVGSAYGAVSVFHIDPILLKIIITILLLFVLIPLYFGKKGLTESSSSLNTKQKIFLLLAMIPLSIYAGFIGVSFVTFVVFCFLQCKQSYTQSMGYALIIGTWTSLVSGGIMLIWYPEHIYFSLAFPQIIGMSIGGFLGAKYALFKGNIWVKNALTFMVILAIIKLCLDIFPVLISS